MRSLFFFTDAKSYVRQTFQIPWTWHPKPIENFLEALKKIFSPPKRFCQNIPTWFWASFFQNLNFFHFSWHKIWLVRRVVTIFLLTQRTRLGGPFRYLEHVPQTNIKFFRGLWKKVSAQKMGFCQNIPTRFWASFLLIFWIETFFKGP